MLYRVFVTDKTQVGIVLAISIVVEVGGLATVFATFANDVVTVALIAVVVAGVYSAIVVAVLVVCVAVSFYCLCHCF